MGTLFLFLIFCLFLSGKDLTAAEQQQTAIVLKPPTEEAKQREDKSIILPSTQDEIRMGYAMDAIMQQHYVILQDAKLENKIKEIGENLLLYSQKRKVPYTFRIVNHNDINAFAVPGGILYILYGMLRIAESEDEVAAILAHEIAHVEKRHGVKDYRVQQTLDLLYKSAVLGLSLSGQQSTSQNVQALGPLAALIGLNSYSRHQEREADDYGADIMAQSKYDPAAMVSIMKKILIETEKQKLEKGHTPSILLTHPPTQERIEYLTQKVQSLKNQTKRIDS